MMYNHKSEYLLYMVYRSQDRIKTTLHGQNHCILSLYFFSLLSAFSVNPCAWPPEYIQLESNESNTVGIWC